MKRWPLIIAPLLATAFAVYFSWFDIVRHEKTNSTRFDLGNVEQVEWNIIHGRGFVATDPYGLTTISRFAFHADVFLIVLAPIYALFPHTSTLLVLQAVIVASGALAAYFLGRTLLSPWWGVVFAWLYAINPAIHWATIFDVHAVTFAIPLILWIVVAALRKNYWWTLVLIILAMMTKEEIGIGLTVIGFYVWLKQKNVRWGSVLTLVPLLWSMTMLFIVLPHFRPLSAASTEVYQTVFGTGARDAIVGLVQHPLSFVHQLVATQNLVMAGQLLSGFGFLPVVSWWSLGALPDYGINALSLKPAQHLVISHYPSGILPWLILATMMAVAWMKRRLISGTQRLRQVLTIAVSFWLLGWSSYSAWAFGPLPGARHDNTPVVSWRNDYAASVARWEKEIPPSAAVSVTNNIGSHFARRENLYSFPLGVDQADYVVVLEGHATPVVTNQADVATQINYLRSNPTWKILEQTGDLTVLIRKR